MSGGSYNYLCNRMADEILQIEGDIENMTERLASLGYAKDAAKETALLLARMRTFEVYVETAMERLRDVWKAVEWWDSADWGEDEVKQALEKYREPDKC